MAELGNRTFCDQVRLVYAAKLVVGVFGAALGGNVLFAHDASTTIELTACGQSWAKGLGHTFQPLAAAHAKGYVVFCLCVDDASVDIGAKRTTRRGWFRSDKLKARAGALSRVATRVLGGAYREAADILKEPPCGKDSDG